MCSIVGEKRHVGGKKEGNDKKRDSHDEKHTTATATSIAEQKKEDDDGQGFFFLSRRARMMIPRFQYRGEDKSLLYNYALSPLASFLVHNCTPQSIAPNTITLSGLVLMVSAYAAIWFYCPNMELEGEADVAPRWIFALNAVSMLCYQTLDNMDGKQARRTSSSSPLGLLFDHGCDAINSIVGSANWIVSLGLSFSAADGDRPLDHVWCMILVFGPFAIFYLTTWEEYYTGELVLPTVNGPSEGLFLGAMLSLCTCLWGTEFWQSTGWYDGILRPALPSRLVELLAEAPPRNADLEVGLACMIMIREIVLRLYFVVRRYGAKQLWNVLPLGILTGCSFAMVTFDRDVWIRMPRTSFHLFSGLFVETVTQLMLDHISEERHRPLERYSVLPLLALTALVGSGVIAAGTDTDSFLLVYATGVWTFVGIKTTIVFHEISTVLNIWCFDIVTPRRPPMRRPSTFDGSIIIANRKEA